MLELLASMQGLALQLAKNALLIEQKLQHMENLARAMEKDNESQVAQKPDGCDPEQKPQ